MRKTSNVTYNEMFDLKKLFNITTESTFTYKSGFNWIFFLIPISLNY